MSERPVRLAETCAACSGTTAALALMLFSSATLRSGRLQGQICPGGLLKATWTAVELVCGSGPVWVLFLSYRQVTHTKFQVSHIITVHKCQDPPLSGGSRKLVFTSLFRVSAIFASAAELLSCAGSCL